MKAEDLLPGVRFKIGESSPLEIVSRERNWCALSLSPHHFLGILDNEFARIYVECPGVDILFSVEKIPLSTITLMKPKKQLKKVSVKTENPTPTKKRKRVKPPAITKEYVKRLTGLITK